MIDAQDADAFRAIVRGENRRLIKRINRRIVQAENNAELALRSAANLHSDLYGDPNQRSGPDSLYERLGKLEGAIEKNHQAVMARLDPIERSVKRWRTMERVAVGVATSGVVRMARRMLPAVMIGVTMALTFVGFLMFMRA
jgi:hypothetical protein